MRAHAVPQVGVLPLRWAGTLTQAHDAVTHVLAVRQEQQGTRNRGDGREGGKKLPSLGRLLALHRAGPSAAARSRRHES
eukprot:3924137-Lingulodinium_polyedra.AAC.1